MYYDGYLFDTDYEQAAYYAKKASNVGDGAYLYAVCLATGRGVVPNLKEAENYAKKAIKGPHGPFTTRENAKALLAQIQMQRSIAQSAFAVNPYGDIYENMLKTAMANYYGY